MKQRAVNSSAAGNVIVAVKAEKVISKTALAWALSHVVHPGDCVMLLAVLPGHKTGRRRSLWSFPRLTGDCGTGDREKFRERVSHQISESACFFSSDLNYANARYVAGLANLWTLESRQRVFRCMLNQFISSVIDLFSVGFLAFD
ncbi:non-specific serine,threonine protein kinase [Sarracenia purpurea var. burkii]